MQERLAQEKSIREQQEEHMLGVLADLKSKVSDQIQVERYEREKSEESMINLLEQTCNKLNHVKFEV